METNTITKDKRTITSLAIDYNQRVHDWNPSLGANGVTKIEAYDEVGEMAYVAWFAIYIGEEIAYRVNRNYVVEVSYAG